MSKMLRVCALASLALWSAPGCFDRSSGGEEPASDGVQGEVGVGEATAVAHRLVDQVPAATLAEEMLEDPSLLASTLDPLAIALMDRSVPGIEDYLADVARMAAGRLARRRSPWNIDDLDLVLTILLVHPRRFVEEDAFRAQVATILPRAFDPALPPALRDDLLVELNRVRGVDFELSERVAVGWGAVLRPSLARYEESPSSVAIDADGPIEASVLSLPSRYVDPARAERFLAGLERLAPERDLLVLSDGVVLAELAAAGRGPRTRLIDTYGRPHTPWARDPFLFARRADGGVLLIQRPNLQPGREADGFMGRELIQQLPPELDDRWGAARWTRSPVPFHNGQILLTAGEAWISLHGLEIPVLERLGLARVPVASFATTQGVDRYLQAARDASTELGAVFQRRARFVHDLPESGPAPAREAAMRRLGGGAGFDLDSLVTLLPSAAGGATALVADVDVGAAILAAISESEMTSLIETYGLRGLTGDTLAAVSRYAASPRARGLDGFLEAVADHLSRLGWRVDRLPLLLVPRSLLAEAEDVDLTEQVGARLPEFLVGWNNVVLETTADARRAEGFAAGLDSGDEIARRIYAAAGYELRLLPALAGSVVNNGGYRCASNHLRSRS